MSYAYRFNFEKVAMTVIEENLNEMTDDNFEDQYEDTIDLASLIPNIKKGSICIFFIECLFEASVNSIIRVSFDNYEELIKSCISAKLVRIAEQYGFDILDIKNSHLYCKYREMEKTRNDLTHFKSNNLSTGSMIFGGVAIDKGTSKKAIADIFTRTNIKCWFDSVLELIKLICSKCTLFVNMDVDIIDSDGHRGVFEFIVKEDSSLYD